MPFPKAKTNLAVHKRLKLPERVSKQRWSFCASCGVRIQGVWTIDAKTYCGGCSWKIRDEQWRTEAAQDPFIQWLFAHSSDDYSDAETWASPEQVRWAFLDAANMSWRQSHGVHRELNQYGWQIFSGHNPSSGGNNCGLTRLQQRIGWAQKADLELSREAAWELAAGLEKMPRSTISRIVKGWKALVYRRNHIPRALMPHKLTIVQAREIRTKFCLGESKRSLARTYSVSPPMISLVVSNSVYKEATANAFEAKYVERRQFLGRDYFTLPPVSTQEP